MGFTVVSNDRDQLYLLLSLLITFIIWSWSNNFVYFTHAYIENLSHINIFTLPKSERGHFYVNHATTSPWDSFFVWQLPFFSAPQEMKNDTNVMYICTFLKPSPKYVFPKSVFKIIKRNFDWLHQWVKTKVGVSADKHDDDQINPRIEQSILPSSFYASAHSILPLILRSPSRSSYMWSFCTFTR